MRSANAARKIAIWLLTQRRTFIGVRALSRWPVAWSAGAREGENGTARLARIADCVRREVSVVGDNITANSARVGSALDEPATVGPDEARRQRAWDRCRLWRLQDGINYAAPALRPLSAAGLRAWIREPERPLRLARVPQLGRGTSVESNRSGRKRNDTAVGNVP